MMVFFMCHCLAWFIADYIQLTGVQVLSRVPVRPQPSLQHLLQLDRRVCPPFSVLTRASAVLLPLPHRAARCASPSWTLLWRGSSGSRWPCRSSCRRCGTRRSAGGPAATGCGVAAPPRKFWMSRRESPPPRLLLEEREQEKEKQETDLFFFVCFLF